MHGIFAYLLCWLEWLYHVKRVQFACSRVPASIRTISSMHTVQTHRGEKWRLRGRRVIQDRSLKSSVVSNESCFRRDIAMKSHIYSYQSERIASLSKEGKSISQMFTILESEGPRTSRDNVRKGVNRWETNRRLHDQHCSGRPSKFTPKIATFMEAMKLRLQSYTGW